MLLNPRHLFGRSEPVPLATWDKTGIGDLVMATYKNIRHRTMADLHDLLQDYHISDQNISLIKETGGNIFSFTPEAERFLKRVIDETPHSSVRAALIYDLIRGYFTVSQSIRSAGLKGMSLSEAALSESSCGSHVSRSIEHWNVHSADEIEEDARRYAITARSDALRRERLYENHFDADGRLFRTLKTTLGRRVETLLYQMEHFSVGKKVKDEVFTTLTGQSVSLARRSGKVALIDIWSTGCGPCRKKLGELMELKTDLEGASFEIITMNVDKTREALDSFLDDPKLGSLVDYEPGEKKDEYFLSSVGNRTMTLPVVYIGLRSPLLKLWDITAYPTIVLLDGNGTMHVRGHDIPRAEIDSLLRV